MDRKKLAKEIIDNRDFQRMSGMGSGHPIPGSYVITGPQQGQADLENYFGYVVQVRKKAGCYGSDMILIRHPHGGLVRHENQCYCGVNEHWKEKIISMFSDEDGPEKEDYTQPYTLSNNEFPEVGKIIEPKGCQSDAKSDPFMITTTHADGSKTMTAFVD